jgi:hypothetical protein
VLTPAKIPNTLRERKFRRIFRGGTRAAPSRKWTQASHYGRPLKAPPHSADEVSVPWTEDYERRELQLNRFKRLLGELLHGEVNRNTFQAWEIDLLLDFDTCPLPSRRRLEILRQYQKAVERQMETGPGPPMKLSTFLILREQRRNTTQE